MRERNLEKKRDTSTQKNCKLKEPEIRSKKKKNKTKHKPTNYFFGHYTKILTKETIYIFSVQWIARRTEKNFTQTNATFWVTIKCYFKWIQAQIEMQCVSPKCVRKQMFRLYAMLVHLKTHPCLEYAYLFFKKKKNWMIHIKQWSKDININTLSWCVQPFHKWMHLVNFRFFFSFI